MNREARGVWAAAIVLGWGIAGALVVSIGPPLAEHRHAAVLLVGVSGLLLAPWLVVVVREVLGRAAGATPLWRRRALAGCLAVAAALAAVGPFERVGTHLAVTVEATGEHHPEARGAEVWVRLEVDGEPVPLNDLSLSGGCRPIDGYAVCGGGGLETVRWQGVAQGAARVVFVSHEWSGQARVRWADRLEALDLYSSPAGPGTIVELLPPRDAARLRPLPRSGLEWFVEAFELLLLAAVLFGALALLTRPPSGRAAPPPRAAVAEALVLATPLALTGAWAAAIYAPAIMTVDSVDQWTQASTLELNDGHPIFYALLIAGLRWLWDSPAAVALLQTGAMSVAVGTLSTVVGRGLGAPFWARASGAFAVALHPMVALTTVTLWKDTLFTAATLGLFAWVGLRLFSGPGPRAAWAEPLVVGALGFVAWAMRHNGLPVALACLGTVALALAPARRAALLALVVMVALHSGFDAAVRLALRPTAVKLSWMPIAHRIAAHLQEGQLPATPEDRHLLKEILDAPEWPYSCAVANPTVYASGLNRALAEERQADLLRIWRELALRSPMVEVEHQLCVSALVWRLDDADTRALYLYTVGLEPGPAGVRWLSSSAAAEGLTAASLFPGFARELGAQLLRPGRWWLWRPAVYLYALLLAAVVAKLRAGASAPLVLMVAPVAHSALLALVTPAADARYQLPIYVLALALLPALLASARRSAAPPSPEAAHG